MALRQLGSLEFNCEMNFYYIKEIYLKKNFSSFFHQYYMIHFKKRKICFELVKESVVKIKIEGFGTYPYYNSTS